MSQWMLANLPSMVFIALLESAAATLIAFALCFALLYYSTRYAIPIWKFVAMYVVTLLFQGVLRTLIEIATDLPLMPKLVLLVVVTPVITSFAVLITARTIAIKRNPSA